MTVPSVATLKSSIGLRISAWCRTPHMAVAQAEKLE